MFENEYIYRGMGHGILRTHQRGDETNRTDLSNVKAFRYVSDDLW